MKGLIRSVAGKIERSSPTTVTTLGVLYGLALGMLDYATPEETSFTIFYLLGVAFVGWGAGTRAAVLVSAVSVGIMTAHEWENLDRGALSLGSLAWNASTRFLLFCAVGWLTAEITRLNRHL